MTKEVERHPGPWIGEDAELARACAMAAIQDYGTDDPETHQRILKDGVWNDHVAVQAALAAIHSLKTTINTPETADFMKGVPLEAAHQRERWGVDHDAGKGPLDWFWLVGYLAQKAATSAMAGDIEKAKHHTISTAAALANWHLRLSGGDDRMRPGIAPPEAP